MKCDNGDENTSNNTPLHSTIVKSNNLSAIVFDESTACRLSSEELRLPATYIGVRRIRASSKNVHDAYLLSKQQKKKKKTSNNKTDNDTTKVTDSSGSPSPHIKNIEETEISRVIFKVKDENGNERRMTKREKKDLKFKLRTERQLLKQKQSQLQKLNISSDNKMECESSCVSNNNKTHTDDSTTGGEPSLNILNHDKHHNKYYQLAVNSEEIKREVMELKNEKKSPCVLSPPMAFEAIHMNLLNRHNYLLVAGNDLEDSTINSSIEGENSTTSLKHINTKINTNNISINDELANEWAKLIKQKFHIAEELRAKDPIRPMAYQIVPEVWSRLRSNVEDNNNNKINNDDETKQTIEKEVGKPEPASVSSSSSSWSFLSIRPTQSQSSYKIDDDNFVIFHQLYSKFPGLQISCGAKFGCDYLLYDGNREERHAFAGLRIINQNLTSYSKAKSNNTSTFEYPIPSPYDLAGYVRGLNTAGKLALLATVVRCNDNNNDNENNNDGIQQQQQHVLLIDLALEKILTAPTHQKKHFQRKKNKKNKRKREDTSENTARKEIGKNLSKVPTVNINDTTKN